MNTMRTGILFAFFLLACLLHAEEPSTPETWQRRTWGEDGQPALAALEASADGGTTLPVAFPGQQEFVIGLPKGFPRQAAKLNLEMVASAPLPADTRLYVFTRDWEYRWRQVEFSWSRLLAATGRGNTVAVSIPLAEDQNLAWQPVGHSQPWTSAVPGQIREWGLILVSRQPCQAKVVLRRPVVWEEESTAPTVRALGWTPLQPRVGEIVEGGYEIEGWRGSPFNAADVSLSATILPPGGGAPLKIPGFYMEKFQRTSQKVLADGATLVSAGHPCFVLRYLPERPGPHRIQVAATVGNKRLELPEQTLEVADAPRPFKGFVRQDPKDPRFLAYEDGTFFRGVMLNVRSPYDVRYADIARYTCWKDDGLDLYARLLPKYKEARINVVEVWMSSWWLGLEWTDEVHGCHGVGWYNQRRAWMLDRIFSWAAANDIKVVLVLNNHGKFGNGQFDSEWPRNPYFKKNGGPVANCEEFFVSDPCLAAQRQFAQYVIARWGASPQLLSWKLFTEIDLTGNSMTFYRTPPMTQWHQQMTDFFRNNDPWRHLVSTHWMMDYAHVNPEVASLPKLDLLTIDAYYMSGGSARLFDLFRGGAEVAAAYKKPCFITEYGGSAYGENTAVLQRQFYLGPWLAFFNGHACGAGFWWYPLVEEKNLYGMLKGFVAFTDGEDPRGAKFQSGLSGGRDVEINLVRQPGRLLVWGFDRVGFSNERNSEDWVEYPDYAVPVGGLVPGTYAVESWDTATGAKTGLPDLVVAAGQGIVDVKVPPFKRDFGLKLIKRP